MNCYDINQIDYQGIVTVIGLILGILGLVGTIISILAYMNPITRLKWYFKKPQKWEKIHTEVLGVGEFYRHKNRPEFVIERAGTSREWTRKELWMKNYPNPLMSSVMVHVKMNGQVLLAEEFIHLDESRYFVPVPRVIYSADGEEKNNVYYYTKIQQLIAGIVGEYYRTDSLHQFMAEHNISSLDR